MTFRFIWITDTFPYFAEYISVRIRIIWLGCYASTIAMLYYGSFLQCTHFINLKTKWINESYCLVNYKSLHTNLNLDWEIHTPLNTNLTQRNSGHTLQSRVFNLFCFYSWCESTLYNTHHHLHLYYASSSTARVLNKTIFSLGRQLKCKNNHLFNCKISNRLSTQRDLIAVWDAVMFQTLFPRGSSLQLENSEQSTHWALWENMRGQARIWNQVNALYISFKTLKFQIQYLKVKFYVWVIKKKQINFMIMDFL